MSTLNDIDFGSESEGDFNPAQHVESDEEGVKERRLSQPKQKTSKRPSPAARPTENDDDNEEDEELNADAELGEEEQEGQNEADEEDDEDEDEEDEVSGRPRKRARRDQRNQFIDIEAEVDEEDEEGDEDDEAEGAGFIAEDHPDDLGDLPAGAETDDRRHRELDRKREHELQMDAEKQAALLKERYGRSRVAASDATLVPRRLLLPSVDDPSIWGARCKPGKEREVVMSIMKRVEERRFSRNPMPIISALERGGTMTGYVYIETRRQADIIPALDGIMNVYPRTKIVLVPIKEMPDLLRVRKTESLQPGGYVRLRRGKYQGDLAQIEEVETNGLEVTLRIVPRLDYGLTDDPNAPVDGQGEKRKRVIGFNIKNRPPQRLFSEAEARKKHARNLVTMSNLSSRKHFQFFGDIYRNGYLIKEFRINHLQTEDVNPTLEEVTKFTAAGEDGNENLDLTALAASLKSNTTGDNYLPGDMVEVFDGEQQGVFGKAVAVRGDIVTISVAEGELKGQRIEIPIKGLQKRFNEGDHVKVIGGSRFRDEVGLVVRVKNDQVTIVSDLSMQEITVFSKDLRVADDSGVAGGLGRYDIHDLVQLDPSTVGCVIKVDRESLRVLDQNASVKTVMPSQITNKIEKRRNAVATDRNGSEIRHDDTVREIGGESKTGTIVHIHRSYLFLLNREQTENSGIFVVRASNVATVAAKGGRLTQQANTGPDLNKMNPALQRNGAPNGGMAPPKSFGRDRILGQTVKIRKGPYKGLLGIVKDTTDTEARIELHTKNKTISLQKDILGIQDPITGNSIPYAEFAEKGRGGGIRSGYGGVTPARPNNDFGGSRTPQITAANGGRTPAWGASRTPAWGSGGGGGGGGGWGGSAMPSRTPAYSRDSGMNGGRTPAWGSGGDGGRTSYGGIGGRTPAWESGSRTSYGSNTVSDGFGSGGKTPAYESSRTPAYTGSSFHNSNPDPWSRPHDAPTPGAPPASTPSNPYSAPTPAASAPTPKFSGYGAMDAPTPAAAAPTPYGGNPETPAWGGDDDDGPRYDDSPSP